MDKTAPAENVLSAPVIGDKIAPTSQEFVFDARKYLEAQRVMLRMWLADVERMLGYNPKRCPQCGHEHR